jgi:hypothetical protein
MGGGGEQQPRTEESALESRDACHTFVLSMWKQRPERMCLSRLGFVLELTITKHTNRAEIFYGHHSLDRYQPLSPVIPFAPYQSNQDGKLTS